MEKNKIKDKITTRGIKYIRDKLNKVVFN